MERDVQAIPEENGGVCPDDGGSALDVGAVVPEGGHDPLPGSGECDADGEGLLEELDLISLNPRLRAKLERQSEQEKRLSREQRESLAGLLPAGQVRFDEPMSAHSVSGAGGSAEAFVVVEGVSELIKLLGWSTENMVDYRFWGDGSATLVRDGGVAGLMVKLGREFADADLERQQADEAFVRVGAACKAGFIAALCRTRGFSGAEEFAEYGGTTAGALFAKGRRPDSTLTSVIEEVTIVTKDGKELTLRGQALRFEDGALKVPKTSAVIRMLLKLKAAGVQGNDGEDAKNTDTQKGLVRVFASDCKTPASVFIEEAGLRGVRVGKARVAVDDTNFIINEGSASAKDIAVLMNLVRDRVKEQSGVTLTQLVEVIGE